MGDCGKETWFCCSVTHARYAQTCIADTISVKSRVLGHLKKKHTHTHTKKRLIPCNVAQRRLSLGWPKSEHASAYVSASWRPQQDCEQVLERAVRQMCAAIFKKKNVVGEKRYFNRPILKLNPLKNSYNGRLDFAASEQQRHRSDCDDGKTSVFVCWNCNR